MSNEIIECIIIVVKEYFENMEMEMKSEILLGLTNMMNEILIKSINKCGVMYNFNSEEAMRMLFLDVKVAESKSKSKPVKESKKVVPMPYDGKMKENCCKALVLNHGLYSQCSTSVEDVRYCKKCGDDPEYGTIEERLRMDCMEFRDKKGKSPTHYSKVMKKLKISREEVLEEAGKLNIIIDDFHFEEEKKEKGRPKKPKRKVELADDSTDLFAALVAKANESESEYSSDESSIIAESVIESVLDKVSVITENNEKKAAKESEKQAQRQAEKEKKESEKQAQRQAEKDKKEAEKQAQKEEKEKKEAEKQAEKEKKEAEKQAQKEEKDKKEAEKQAQKAEKEKKEAEKQAQKAEKDKKDCEKAGKEKKEAEKQAQKAEKDKKEAEKQAQKAAKDAEKAAKDAEKAAKEAQKQAEKEKKESEKVSGKKSQKSKKDSSSEVEKKVEKKEVEEDDEEDVVKRFEFEGVKYLKSKKTGVIYNMDQELIGKWNEKTNKIDFNIQDSEEEEEEYDE